MESSADAQNANITKTKKSRKNKRSVNSPRKKLSLKRILAAIPGTYGIISTLADKLQCSRQAIYKYRDRYKEVRDALDEEEENVLDAACEGLYAKLLSQEWDAIRYVLDKKGHKRGFGEGPNTSGLNGAEKAGVLVVPGVYTGDAWQEAAKVAAENKGGGCNG